jgi:DNA-binding transcriptional ArsR family regulator
MTDEKTAKACADLLQALGEPNRLRIVDLLRSGSKNVTEISRLMQEEIVNVSHHLSVLRDAGLVENRRDGRFIIYSLHPRYFRSDSSNATCLDLGWCRVEIPHH